MKTLPRNPEYDIPLKQILVTNPGSGELLALGENGNLYKRGHDGRWYKEKNPNTLLMRAQANERVNANLKRAASRVNGEGFA